MSMEPVPHPQHVIDQIEKNYQAHVERNTTRAILEISSNEGYSADQVPTALTLGQLMDLLDEAIESYGEDAIIVTRDAGNRYGARWGKIYADPIETQDDREEEA